jgi:plastocyanin
MRPPIRLWSLLLFALSSAASASTFSVQVTGTNGKPVGDAVVTLHAIGRPTPSAPIGNRYTVAQKDLRFRPFVLIVPVNSDVSFPNLDAVRHHVYSFSAAKRFELKLYARDQTRSVHLDRAGIIPLGCNIHDSMSAFLFVTDSVWTARTDRGGRAAIGSLPAGKYMMTSWHPYLRAPANQVSKPITIGTSDHGESVTVTLRSPPMHDMSGY